MWEAIVIFGGNDVLEDANECSTVSVNTKRIALIGRDISPVRSCLLFSGILGWVNPVSYLTMLWPNILVFDFGFMFQGDSYFGGLCSNDGRVPEPDISDFDSFALQMGFDPILGHVTFLKSCHRNVPVVTTRGCYPFEDTACVLTLDSDNLFLSSLFGHFPLLRVFAGRFGE